MDGPVVTVPCTAERTFFPDMPTTAAAMGPYLEQTQGIRLNDLNDLSKTVGFMLESDYILPAQRAALYRFLATTPRADYRAPRARHQRASGHRRGLALLRQQSDEHLRSAHLRLPGHATWGEQGQLGGDALVRTAIVDQAGELP